MRNPDRPVPLVDLPGVSWLTARTMIGYGDHHCTGTLKDWDIFDELERIEVPTLVLGGELDECIPSHPADIASRIPDAEHITLPGTTHMPYLEAEPIVEQYLATIRDYLSKVEARAQA